MSTATPRFRKPPVIETVLGVQFEPLREMRIVHFGMFWELVRDTFPRVEERPPLEPVIEAFDRAVLQPAIGWRIFDRPELPRAWFLSDESEAGEQLIQLQPDHLLQNWRRRNSGEGYYPAYGNNRGRFESTLRRFIEFAQSAQIGEIRANQCEVTYVNHIAIPAGCEYGSYLIECFPLLAGRPSDPFLPPSVEQAACRFSYRMPDDRGRLYISIDRGAANAGGPPIIDLRLTARGKPDSTELAGVMAWLDLGHNWVVNGFRSFTSRKMHSLWELEPE